MEKHDKTLRQIGRPALYKLGHSFFLAFLHCHNYVNTFIVYDRKPFGRNVTVKESPFRWHPLQSISDERSSFGRNNVFRWLFRWNKRRTPPMYLRQFYGMLRMKCKCMRNCITVLSCLAFFDDSKNVSWSQILKFFLSLVQYVVSKELLNSNIS